MKEIVLMWAMAQPVEFRKDCTWWGCRAVQAGNVQGHTIKVVVWPQSVIIEFGVWNTLLISKRLW